MTYEKHHFPISPSRNREEEQTTHSTSSHWPSGPSFWPQLSCLKQPQVSAAWQPWCSWSAYCFPVTASLGTAFSGHWELWHNMSEVAWRLSRSKQRTQSQTPDVQVRRLTLKLQNVQLKGCRLKANTGILRAMLPQEIYLISKHTNTL